MKSAYLRKLKVSGPKKILKRPTYFNHSAQSSDQPDLGEDVPAHCRGVELDDL